MRGETSSKKIEDMKRKKVKISKNHFWSYRHKLLCRYCNIKLITRRRDDGIFSKYPSAILIIAYKLRLTNSKKIWTFLKLIQFLLFRNNFLKQRGHQISSQHEDSEGRILSSRGKGSRGTYCKRIGTIHTGRVNGEMGE